jgi:hypothetical protein
MSPCFTFVREHVLRFTSVPSAQPVRLLSAREALSRRLTPHHALVATQNARLSRIVTRVLKAVGMTTVVCEDPSLTEQWMERSRPDLVVYDIGSDTPESRRVITELTTEESAPSLILLSEGSDVPMLRDLLTSASGYNLVLKNGLIDNGDLLVTARKLVGRDIFGIDKYLRWGSILHTYEPVSSAEKNDILRRVEEFLNELQCEQRYVLDLINALDEFLTNAFFHAPSENGVALFSNSPPTQIITLPTWKRPTIEYGSDGRLVGIAVRDPFGSFDTAKVLGHLAEHAETRLAEVRQGPGGAGIGLYTTFRTVDHLVINVEAGVATELIALVDVTVPYREHARAGRTLNVFTLDPFVE